MRKNASRNAVIRRHLRLRKKISGTAACPRLNVFRSLANIYAQIIDDEAGVTLVSANTLDKEIKAEFHFCFSNKIKISLAARQNALLKARTRRLPSVNS